MKMIIVASLIAMSLNLYAIEVTVQYSQCNGGLTTNQCEQLDSEIKSSIEEELPDVSLNDYASGIANSNAFAQNGLGSDYSDVFTYAMVRGGIGAAVQGELDDEGSAEGFGIGAAVTFGLNLNLLPVDKIGPVEFDKMNLFVSVMSYDVDNEDDDFAAEGEFKSFSVMARYQIVDAVDIVPGNLFNWGGVMLHTGFQRSTFDAELTTFIEDQTVESGGLSANLEDASATFAVDTTTSKIPVEVSTSIRGLWALTLYTGAGFDFVTGDADVSLVADGDAQGQGAASGYRSDVTASDKADGEVDATNFRAFAGLQINIPFVRVYTHLNKGLGNDLLGANAGVKILW